MADERSIASDSTNVYVAGVQGINKIVESTGVQATLGTTQAHALGKRFKSLTYGNSVLYGADQDGIYSVHVTTGVLAVIVRMTGITNIMYHDTTHLVVTLGNSLIELLLADGTFTYIAQDI